MAFPGSGAGDNLFEQVLGDLLKVMGGAGGGTRVDLARTLAHSVAASGEPEPNVDPAERMAFEQLAHVAELHVAELTGLPITPTGAPTEVTAVGPGMWAWHTVEEWRFLLDAMSATPPPAGATDASGPSDPAGDRPPPSEGPAPPGLGLTDLGGPPDTTSGPGDMLARMMGTLGPMLAALQLGSVVGHLARTTLGPYELPIPRPSARLLVVPANVTRFAEEWSLAPDEVRLWVCVREETIQAVLTRPHVAGRLRELLVDVVRGMAEDAAGVVDQMKGLDPSDPGALERLLDPAALLGAEPTPARQRAAADLMAVTAALLGYVEHVLDQAAARLLGGRSAISEAWRRRQVGRESSDLAAEAMFGLDLGPAQIDRGSEFVHGVLERGGDEGLARLWSAAHTLPTPAEVDAPGLWLERIDLAES